MDYDIRTILTAIKLMPQPKTFLYDTFVDHSSTEFSLNDVAEVDVQKGDVRLAPLVASDVGGIVMEREGHKKVFITYPTIAPERPVTSNDIKNRLAGENIYSGMSAAERSKQIMADDLVYLRTAVANRLEFMIAQLLFQTPGKMMLDVMTKSGLAKGALKVNYMFENDVTLAKQWSDPSANPINDLDTLTSLASNGGLADIIVMGNAAAAAYKNNPNTRETLNVRNIQAGTLSASYIGPYVKFLGISPNGIEMYEYTATVVNDDGVKAPFVPSNKVAVLSRELIRESYAAVTQIDFGQQEYTTYAYLKEVPNRVVDQANNVVSNRLTSRPMLIPKNIDGWATADVL